MSNEQEVQQAEKKKPNIQLYHLMPLYTAPSASPFVVKLMTYLRMAKIDYSVVESRQNSSKGKSPFVLFNGKEIADTTFIINFLNKEMSVDLNSGLSECEKAISLAFQRLNEENLYWVLVHGRWHVKKEVFFTQFPISGFMRTGMRALAYLQIKPAMDANLHGHGMGRHSKEEIYSIAERDICALSTYLGEKQFFMGESPSEIDCTLFGTLVQFAYVKIGLKQETLLQEKYPNLLAYCDRMKEKYWPDWEEQCAKKK